MKTGKPSEAPRRQHVRRDLALRAIVRLHGEEIEAVTENISVGGAFLRVDVPAGTRELLAQIDLPNGKQMRVKARVCWRREAPQVGVGVSFEQFVRSEPPPPNLFPAT